MKHHETQTILFKNIFRKRVVSFQFFYVETQSRTLNERNQYAGLFKAAFIRYCWFVM